VIKKMNVLDPPRTNQSRRNPLASRVLGAFVVAGTTVLATLALATPASAHKDDVSAKCDETTQKTTLTLDLTWYGDKQDNTVEVSVDGKPLPRKQGEPTKIPFRGTYNKAGWETDGKVAQKYHVSIKAYDDPYSKNGWSKEIDVPPTKVCVTPATKTTTSTTTTTTTTTTTSEAPSSSVTPPAPGGSTPEPPLAATGAAPVALLLSGLGLVGAGAGTLLFLRRRRSA
jgi:hypothetical protein